MASGLLSLGLAVIASAAPSRAIASKMDRDLMEVTVLQLQRYYAEHRYTVTEVVQWHLARIHHYNGIYRAVETVMEKKALETAAREDADAAAAIHKQYAGLNHNTHLSRKLWLRIARSS